MDWIKHVILDLAVTALLVAAVLLGWEAARWIVMVYTPLMVLLKGFALASSRSLGALKRKDGGVPPAFYHVLYGLNVLVPLAGRWWIMAAAWALIWALSVAIEAQRRPALAR